MGKEQSPETGLKLCRFFLKIEASTQDLGGDVCSWSSLRPLVNGARLAGSPRHAQEQQLPALGEVPGTWTHRPDTPSSRCSPGRPRVGLSPREPPPLPRLVCASSWSAASPLPPGACISLVKTSALCSSLGVWVPRQTDEGGRGSPSRLLRKHVVPGVTERGAAPHRGNPQTETKGRGGGRSHRRCPRMLQLPSPCLVCRPGAQATQRTPEDSEGPRGARLGHVEERSPCTGHTAEPPVCPETPPELSWEERDPGPRVQDTGGLNGLASGEGSAEMRKCAPHARSLTLGQPPLREQRRSGGGREACFLGPVMRDDGAHAVG